MDAVERLTNLGWLPLGSVTERHKRDPSHMLTAAMCLQVTEQRAQGGQQEAAEAFQMPRPPNGAGRFVAAGEQRVSADRLEFRRLNLARLRMCAT